MASEVNRRGFLTGLGVLLATTALVRPAAPVIEAVTNAALPGSVPPMAGEMYVVICDPWQRSLYEEIMALPPQIGDITFPGTIGEYLGFKFVDEAELTAT